MSPAKLPQGCTNFKVRQLMRHIGRIYDAEMANCGLKTTQYSLLSNVLNLGPIRPADLAEAMHMTPSTLSRNLQPLLAAGWIEMGAGVDARSRLLRITDAGRVKRREAQGHWKVAQLALNERLGADKVSALHALIDDSLALLGSEPEGESDQEVEGAIND
ncbi:MarR family winged helix-turn-helix transcriptional regulator [Variovorax dokdonensis]|uniref:MarR family winged helix-turn-helix transcriptional regulator n=1 Tax=Variovorax dokdonensis TaxID=344883 RepID=A0ABT7N7K5_9BURK|nr:MarR family winged helix-turn-helix transcriptional regulator [Variovorax dokdonensis]MDM0043912.1 MarR family winged helix-turn-helix transcriptional regulator [Variovorax dokdonensis]